MLTRKDIQRLLDFQAPAAEVVSLYLEVGGPAEPLRDLRALVAKRGPFVLKEADAGADLKRMEIFLADFDPQGSRGLALFAARRFGLWRACPLPEAVRVGLTVGHRPCLPPFLSLVDQYQRYGVALVDAGRTRFLEAFMGRIAEHEGLPGMEATDAPTNAKDVATALEALTRRQGLQRIILVAPPAAVPLLSGHLHSRLQDNLILDPEMHPSMEASEILARIQAREWDARKVRELVLAHRLLDEAAKGSGVLGLAPTLEAFRAGRLRRLLVRQGFAKLGRRCGHCGRLSLEETRCLDCRRATEAVFDLIDELVQRALDMGCEVVKLFHGTPLDNKGRIGGEVSSEGRLCGLPAGAAC